MPKQQIWGAAPDDWFHFSFVLGLTPDLLPVVSRPDAPISPTSKLKTTGKTPSHYNGQGMVAGLKDWTARTSTDDDVGRWAKQPDYGILLQTRTVRALDVDVSDPVVADAILSAVTTMIGPLPKRMRANSPKFLLAFQLEGQMSKRILRTEAGNIEFLATGQQFVALGTHPSGARYEWDGGLPDEIPVLGPEDFEAVWCMLETVFGVGETVVEKEGRLRDRSARDAGATDETADYLDANDWTLDWGAGGERYIRCPFEDGHSTESADNTATAYFPAGTGGFEQGHFRCLHASCAHRNDGDFLNAIGIRDNDFEVIPVAPTEKPPLPAFIRSEKTGQIKATIDNAAKAVMRPDFCGVQIRFDQFRDEIMFAPENSDQWQPFADADYSRLRITLERRSFEAVGKELIRDVVMLAADEQPFDSAMTWLESLKWDGVPRIDCFFQHYFGVEPSAYCRAVSLYTWTALAGRVLAPGCKADMVPILVGPQGCGKSTGVAALSPDPSFFTEISFAEKDDDLARKMRGRLVAEIGELRGLHTKELESIKAFITRTHENWIPKYREFATQFPRRLVFIGTTNQDEFLADDTGNRRWLPLRVGRVLVEQLKTDVLQLWAEARETFKRLGGVQFHDAEVLAAGEHEQHTIKDAWLEIVENWLDAPDSLTDEVPRTREVLRAADVLRDAIGLDPRSIGKREEMRISNVLQNCGYKRVYRRVDGKGCKVWAL
ncbi:VapE domain-containing protein [Serratia marcescens]|uniref:VapE domain-containing protein n=1 Tax=Serratia marcescens TaxID=615 RepID=UPI00217774DD|nr:VapE domain-containing protein [Serratia marcescens]CAI2031732.1 Predicted P-loop ATPase and inactivated derivatives [Serratia marcescens]CAI2099933.1 Predicted P-loop ATPase and inactivated derivatives [Serratia marcescens]